MGLSQHWSYLNMGVILTQEPSQHGSHLNMRALSQYGSHLGHLNMGVIST